ncbi:uncharacterized protein MEPE_06751 [Melanopsichium pennsylvanicum]|uniref:RRN6 K-rich C-terminal domain-containing protein n=2 Tax=Melanopsichium pennsylvanicum TaxID=63383 RepID=A0AAJ4XSE5_9BASI|nr:putative protein [Melanopsichium pennsylvanicum 4]SNX88040.1 uncharacterized protein MEPE_06751 [Melanopsichium pennsylvanicum]
MEPIPSGSRGAVRLHLQGSRSADDAGFLIGSQQWSFPTRQSSLLPRFTSLPIHLQSGIARCLQLTPSTVPLSADRLGLYPSNAAEAGSSVDSDIIYAQRFLHQHHPGIDIPDFVLSSIIHDNARALEDTAHDLGGSLGLADAQAIAVLGPIKLQQKRIYAVVCIGGRNRSSLLLHQLQIHVNDSTEGVHSHSEATAIKKGKAKAVATDSSMISFVPAYDVERKYKTPILQIIASPDGSRLAVRTHSSTSFLVLRHDDREEHPLRLQLGTLHRISYSTDGHAQHQDVCFSRNDPEVAACVNRLGSIDVFRIPEGGRQRGQQQQRQAPDPASATPADDSPARGSPSPGSTGRRSLPPPTLAPVSDRNVLISPATIRHISSEFLAKATTYPEDYIHSDNGSDAEDQATRTSPSFERAVFRISFGSDDQSLFLLSRCTLMHVKFELQDGQAHADTAPQIRTILRSKFCTTSFRRARFFSMASSNRTSLHSILAVCSSDSIHWFDMDEPSKPLFATAHHRGDDPTLFLTQLPPVKGNSSKSHQPEDDTSLWALSSLRNDMMSCYTVVSLRENSSGYDLCHDDSAPEVASAGLRYTLGEAASIIPTSSSSSELLRPSSPPLFLDIGEFLRNGHVFESWITMQINDRGALLARLLQVSFGDVATQQADDMVKFDIMQPSMDSHLYVDSSAISPSRHEQVEWLNNIKTRVLNYKNLHHAAFAGKNDAQMGKSDPISDRRKQAELLLHLQGVPRKGHASVHAATLSLGQLLRDLAERTSNQDAKDTDKAAKSTWSIEMDLSEDANKGPSTTKHVLVFRNDLRHAFSSFSASSAQGSWSRVAAIVADGQTAGATEQDGRGDPLEHALSAAISRTEAAPYLPTEAVVQPWSAKARRAVQDSLRQASRQMMLDLALESEIFVRTKARILDEGAPTQRPQQRQGTNWTAFEHREIYNFVEEQGVTIPPPRVGSIGLSFFAPLRSGDVEATAELRMEQTNTKKGFDEAELEMLLPSTSSTARLLLAEWQLGEDPTEYTYLDPFEGLHRLPRASRLTGPTARARSLSFSRASSASTEDRSRSRSRNRSRKQSAGPSLSQLDAFTSQGPASSYSASLASQSQPANISSGAAPTLMPRRKRQHQAILSRSQPLRASDQGLHRTHSNDPMSMPARATRTMQSQRAAPKFGLAGSFADLTPTVSPALSQIGAPTQSHFGASTQIEAGRFGARPIQADRPPQKKKRASGF